MSLLLSSLNSTHPSALAIISSIMHVIPDLVYSKHEQTRVAQISANYVAHLFNCVSHDIPELKLPPLADFIDSVLDCYFDLAPYCTFVALYLLQRLRTFDDAHKRSRSERSQLTNKGESFFHREFSMDT